jgi:hypothetical protein
MRLRPAVLPVAALAAVLLVAAPAAVLPVAAQPAPVQPAAVVPSSTGGDYATDTFADPWDFANDDDVPPIPLVGTENSNGIRRNADGTLTVVSRNNTTVKLVRTWGAQLPWGRDGQLHPVPADRYTQLSLRMCLSGPLHMAVHYWNAAGEQGLHPFYPPAGCGTYRIDLRDISTNPAGYRAPWTGSMVRVELLRGGTPSGTDPVVDITLDWVRLHRADASSTPPTGLPAPRVLTPGAEGGVDYATASGNPWDFAAPDDVVSSGDLAGVTFGPGGMAGTTVANDSFVELPLRAPTNPDRYHRATIDVCYGGEMGFADAPGGGMNARFAWLPEGFPAWSETQDIIIYPGCNQMTVDLTTDPAVAVNDENTVYKRGWRGQRLARLRFDLNEDPGQRSFTLRSIRLADDAAFSTAYPITFTDTAATTGSTADILVSTDPAGAGAIAVATGLRVTPGVNTFTWNGTDTTGTPLPNATYWVTVVMRNAAGVGTGTATGPLRLERPVSSVPSQFVPITPVRVLDTRTGIGGNLVPLGPQTFTELGIAGVAGIPATDVTAVVLNVTAVDPTAPGYLTVTPSGVARPPVSNLNMVAGQTVPNLVTVKLGANGKVDVFNAFGTTDVVADAVGYYTTSGAVTTGRFTPLAPKRVLDTRTGVGVGGATAPLGAGRSIDLTVAGVDGVPASGVSAVALNVTVDQPTGSSYITVWPTGQARPLASTHNVVAGLTVANLVLAKVGAGGRVSLYNAYGTAHLIADVVGYFSAAGGRFVPLDPQRVVDTRVGLRTVRAAVGPLGVLTIPLVAGGPLPSSASGVVANLTAVNSTAPSYLTAWPAGTAQPLASALNPRVGVAVPNQAYLKLGAGGAVAVFNFAGSTDVLLDVFGYIE